MKSKKLYFIPMLILTVALLAGSAFAEGPDGAGNFFASGDSPMAVDSVERDLYWCGNNFTVSDCVVESDGILAGYSMDVSNCEFGGSFRAAGNSISLNNCTVKNNITAAGYSVTVGKDTKAAGVYAAGNNIEFSGECDHLLATGATVRINGKINGDVSVFANKVIIGEDAEITGTLSVEAATEPVVPEGAKIGKLDFTSDESDVVKSVSASAIILGRLMSRIYWIPAMLVICLLFCLLISKELDGSGKMLLAHPVAMPVTGLVTLCALPVALIILCITAIGAPAAGLIALLFLPILLFSVVFAGSSAARLVFPNMNKIASSVIGVAVLALLKIVPYLGGLITFAAIVYTTGYFILVCYERIKSLKKPAADLASPASLTPEATAENGGSEE